MHRLFRFNRLSTKLVLAVALFMLLFLVTVVTAVNLGLSRLQRDAAHLSSAALIQQGRTDLQKRAALDAALNNSQLARAASLTRMAAAYLVAAAHNGEQTAWDATQFQAYPPYDLLYDANPDRITDLVVPSYVTMDDAQWARIAQSAALDNLFPSLLPQAPDAIAIYYQETSMVFRYYPVINVVQNLAGSPGLAPENARYVLEESPASPPKDPQRLTVWDPPYVDNIGLGLLITANTPVYFGDAYQGVVSIDLSLDRLVEQLQKIQPTAGSYAFIVDENGRLVAAATNGIARLLNRTVEKDAEQLADILGVSLADSDLATILSALLQGDAGLEQTTVGGEEVLLAFAPMPDLGWSLGIAVPLAELTAPADVLTAETALNANGILRLTLGLVIFFFVAALVGVVLTNRRLTRPIADLVRGTDAISAGDLDVAIPVTTQDELGQLAVSFNNMTAVLRQTSASLQEQNQTLQAEMAERQQAEATLRRSEEEHRHELEGRVAERTRELLTLLDVSHNLTLIMALPELLQMILGKLGEVVEYAAASITIAEGELLQQVAYRGPAAEELALTVRPSRQDLGQIWTQLERGEPVVIQDLDEETPVAAAYRALSPKVVTEEMYQANSYLRAWLALPLRLRGQTVGMLALQHPQPGHFSHQRMDLALAFANQAAIAIENARLYEQAQSLAALEERQKLARELHDSVSQALYGIALGTRTASKIISSLPQETQARLDEPVAYILQLAEAGLSEMRALIFELRPESLESEGLVVALEKQTAALRARHRLTVQTDLGTEPDVPLPVKEVCYRVSQEALHNIVKHAGASQVSVGLGVEDGCFTLTIQDNGQGFDTSGQFPGHLGLTSMRERVERVGGEFQIHSSTTQGTTIIVAIPLTARGG
ncbi:MAG: HAMP domain-containing protein [Caldilineaceae bacterium]|nr:HAMP domain-containing protein [Caldilineaceae bacterium]